MKLIKRNLSKGPKQCYVVTRDGRRIEHINYKSQADAVNRASILSDMLKQWDQTTLHKIAIVHTSQPEKIY